MWVITNKSNKTYKHTRPNKASALTLKTRLGASNWNGPTEVEDDDRIKVIIKAGVSGSEADQARAAHRALLDAQSEDSEDAE